jgi:hypothetical protein
LLVCRLKRELEALSIQILTSLKASSNTILGISNADLVHCCLRKQPKDGRLGAYSAFLHFLVQKKVGEPPWQTSLPQSRDSPMMILRKLFHCNSCPVSSKVIVLSSIEIHCWPRSRGLSIAGSIDAVFGKVHYSPVAICGVISAPRH